MTNLVLIGFKSCGKTTLGRLLAARRGQRFVDLDHSLHALLEQRFKIRWNCWEFYSTYGPEKFRELETEALQNHLPEENIVLATGGGAPLREINRPLLSQIGTVCYIQAEPDVIFERFRANGMPAWLEQEPTLERLRAIWQARHEVYRQVAGLTIEAGSRSPEAVADLLEQQLQG